MHHGEFNGFSDEGYKSEKLQKAWNTRGKSWLRRIDHISHKAFSFIAHFMAMKSQIRIVSNYTTNVLLRWLFARKLQQIVHTTGFTTKDKKYCYNRFTNITVTSAVTSVLLVSCCTVWN